MTAGGSSVCVEKLDDFGSVATKDAATGTTDLANVRVCGYNRTIPLGADYLALFRLIWLWT